MLSKNQIKLIKSLKNKKQRHLNKMFIVEGKKSVSEFINSKYDLHKLFSINISDFENRFSSALDDDFNTPIALSILFEIAKQINIKRKDNLKQAKTLAQLLIKLGNYIGILEYDVEDYLKQGMELSELNINEKIRQRDAARDSKDFALSDQIRDELLALGIILEDSSNGTTWRKK